MKDEAREEAVIRICEAEGAAADELFGTPPLIRNAFRAGVEQGYDAAVAAERERIIAELRAEDAAFKKGAYAVDQCCVSIDRAIEIVKGVSDETNK